MWVWEEGGGVSSWRDGVSRNYLSLRLPRVRVNIDPPKSLSGSLGKEFVCEYIMALCVTKRGVGGRRLKKIGGGTNLFLRFK